MDKLAQMYKIQKEFNDNFIDPETASLEDKVSFTKEMLLHIVAEIDELLQATGRWKKFRFLENKPTISGIKEELVDMLKFLLNVAVVWNITPAEIYEEFMRKSLVVEERFKWESLLYNLKSSDKVVAIDLDGVLAKYPENWIEFINKKLHKNYTLQDFDCCSIPLPEVPRKLYYKLKHEFRDRGYESLYVEPFEDASYFTNKLKEMGYIIVILSARPYKKYKRIQSDTILWMKKNNIAYDAFLWDQQKHIRIVEEIPHLKFIVEDNLRIAEQIGALGYKCFLRDRPYNRAPIHSPNVIRVRTLYEVLEKIKEV